MGLLRSRSRALIGALAGVVLATVVAVVPASAGSQRTVSYGGWLNHMAASAAKGADAADKITTYGSIQRQANSYKPLRNWAIREYRWITTHKPQACYAHDFRTWRWAVRLTRSYTSKVLKAVRTYDIDLLNRAVYDQERATQALSRVGTYAYC